MDIFEGHARKRQETITFQRKNFLFCLCSFKWCGKRFGNGWEWNGKEMGNGIGKWLEDGVGIEYMYVFYSVEKFFSVNSFFIFFLWQSRRSASSNMWHPERWMRRKPRTRESSKVRESVPMMPCTRSCAEGFVKITRRTSKRCTQNEHQARIWQTEVTSFGLQSNASTTQ